MIVAIFLTSSHLRIATNTITQFVVRFVALRFGGTVCPELDFGIITIDELYSLAYNVNTVI